MKRSKNLLYLYFLAPISILFLWDINYEIKNLDFSLSPKYIILILLFPILIKLIKKISYLVLIKFLTNKDTYFILFYLSHYIFF